MQFLNRLTAKSVKRFGAFFVSLFLLVLIIPACSSDTVVPTSSTTASPAGTANPTSGNNSSQAIPSSAAQVTPVGADKRVVLTVWTLNWRGNAEYEKFFNSVVDAYHVLHPETTIDWIDLGNDTVKVLDDLLADGKLTTPIKGIDTVPDLVLLDPIDLYQFAGTNRLESLSPLVNNDQKDRYLPNAWEGLQVGANSYGIPWVGRTRITLYNREMWQKFAKQDPNKLPTNFDDLDKVLPIIQKQTPPDVWSVWLKPDVLIDFMMEGAKLIDTTQDGKYSVVFNNAGTQGKWQYYANRRKDKYFFDSCSDGVTKEGFDCFAKSKIAILMEGGQFLPQIKASSPDLYSKNTLVALHPVSKPGILPLIYQGWAVPKGAPNKEKGADFALFIANDENQLAFAKIVQTVVPTTKKALTDPFITALDEPLSQARNLMASVIGKTSPPEKMLPANIGFSLRDRLVKVLAIAQDAVWNGTAKVTPQEALLEAEKAWKEALK
jgi:putative chitobiose transport system substrate-binding protein